MRRRLGPAAALAAMALAPAAALRAQQPAAPAPAVGDTGSSLRDRPAPNRHTAMPTARASSRVR